MLNSIINDLFQYEVILLVFFHFLFVHDIIGKLHDAVLSLIYFNIYTEAAIDWQERKAVQMRTIFLCLAMYDYLLKIQSVLIRTRSVL